MKFKPFHEGCGGTCGICKSVLDWPFVQKDVLKHYINAAGHYQWLQVSKTVGAEAVTALADGIRNMLIYNASGIIVTEDSTGIPVISFELSPMFDIPR